MMPPYAPGGEHEASGIHHGAGGRGGYAVRVERAGAGKTPPRRVFDAPDSWRPRRDGAGCGLFARLAGARLGNGPQYSNRLSMGCWSGRTLSQYALELVARKPDVLVTTVTDTVRALQRAARTIPIVFTSVIDPVGSGLITSLSHPGGNATGFSLFEFGISGKWLELLKQIAPSITRVAVLRDSASTRGVGQFAAIQANASSFGMECFRSMRKGAATSTVLSTLS